MDDPADDPGRFWRRTARCGALIATVIAFRPLDYGQSLAYRLYGDLSDLFRNDEVALFCTNLPWSILFLWMTSASIILSGPLMLLLCSVTSTEAGVRRSLNMLALFGVFLLNALVPFCVVLRLLPPEPEIVRGTGVGAMLIYLMLQGVIVLVTLQKRHQVDLPFWSGLILLGMNLFAWGITAAHGIMATGYSSGDWILIFAALAGAVPLLLGWVKWWRAVKLAQPNARSAIQNPQSEIVNPPSSC